MVEQITFQTMFQFLQTVSIMVGIAYYLMILKNQQKSQQLQLETRQAQLFMTVHDHFTNTSFHRQGNAIRFQWEWSDFDDFIEKYGPKNNLEAWADLLSVFTAFESIGLLVRENLIDVDMVDELMSGLITRTWERIEPIIFEYRERFNWPQAGRSFEYLYNEMKRREQPSQTK